MRSISRLQKFALRGKKNPTKHEDALYSALLLAFRRYRAAIVAQEVIGPYIADFCIYPAKLVVEVDGRSHSRTSQRSYDRKREAYMFERGYRTVRFTNLQIDADANKVAEIIVGMCQPLELAAMNPLPVHIPAVELSEWNPPKRDVYKSKRIMNKNGFRKRLKSSLSSASGISCSPWVVKQ